MYSDALVEKLSLAGHDPADLEKLRAIHEAGQRIQRLARDLVAYARPAGARTEPVDLSGVVDEAARLAKAALKEHGARLQTSVAPVAPVEGSRASLVQVVVNLVTNAAQAAKDGGTVKVTLGPEAGRAVLCVEDDGPGMAPEVEARAFEPFFTTRPASGIGLGLPIVQGIVERHGGTISVDTAAGAGTRVRVSLPARS
jgi:signal transduction histidine kinase